MTLHCKLCTCFLACCAVAPFSCSAIGLPFVCCWYVAFYRCLISVWLQTWTKLLCKWPHHFKEFRNHRCSHIWTTFTDRCPYCPGWCFKTFGVPKSHRFVCWVSGKHYPWWAGDPMNLLLMDHCIFCPGFITNSKGLHNVVLVHQSMLVEVMRLSVSHWNDDQTP